MKKKSFFIVLPILLISFTFMVLASPEFSLIYVIQDGDTLSEIAEDYGISTRQLLAYNQLDQNSVIRVGQELQIPKASAGEKKAADNEQPNWDFKMFDHHAKSATMMNLDVGQVYSVRINPGQKLPDVSNIPRSKIIKYHVSVGDTLYDLARNFNTSIGVIMALNNMERSIIRVGDIISLPINNLTPRQIIYKTISKKDIELLTRVIYGEARGEPFIGQVAVGAVVINRVLSSYFPDTFRAVIFQNRQFSAVADGQINLTPNSKAYRAAKEALKGTDPTMGSMYYYNPKTAKHQSWFKQRRLMVTIGDHVFTK